MRSHFLLFPILFWFITSGCSTFERYTYYSPKVGSIFTGGPDKSVCGMYSFSAPADKYQNVINSTTLKIESNQNFQPYLWGPWLITIIPIFPITWIAEPFRNPDIEFKIYANKDISELKMTEFRLTLNAQTTEEVSPSNIQISAKIILLKFPVKFKSQDKLQLRMRLQGKDIIIPFEKSSRWAWTQWSPNC